MFALGQMPLVNDYSLCTSKVTHYAFRDGEITRTVYQRAYFEVTEGQTLERTGDVSKSEHLIVIPGAVDCAPGDKFFLGVGSEVEGDAASWWRGFIPSKVGGVVVVRKVSPCYWNGETVHTEIRG